VPVSHARHALRIRLSIRWRWQLATTAIVKIQIGRLPGRTKLSLRCVGRNCPRRAHAAEAGGRKAVKRLVARLRGRRYLAGEALEIVFTAPGYRAERARVSFRYDRAPRVAAG
jgi:hypothetical protein